MGTTPTEGYMMMKGDPESTAVAAFVVAMNLLRAVKNAGIISEQDMNAIVENAVAVAEPREGSGVRNHLYAYLSQESRERQDRHYKEAHPEG